MATREVLEMSLSERRRRYFSESFRIKKVREIELKTSKISEISRQYNVSKTTIHRWINKYGSMSNKKTSERVVIESQSDTKQIMALRERIAELEKMVGQKQIQLEFANTMIDIAEEKFGINIKKKSSSKQSNTSGSTERNTRSK